MGEPKMNKEARFTVDDTNPLLQEPSIIRDEDLELRLADKFYYSDVQIPCYEFSIFVRGKDAGTIYACPESDFEKVREIGNVSIELDREFYGKDLPFRATKALLPFFREQGINSILITFDKDKRAVRAACDKLGALYLDTVETTTHSKQIDRFVLEL